MRAIYNKCVDPYFNIAADEYMLTHSRDDVFMLWRNSPAVIVGKNQNTWAEVNLAFVEREKIAVVRRITGGGAVFHDLGNVNFSFITAAGEDAKLNFERFTRPIVTALSHYGVESSLDGRNDIVAGGFKISGNAECVVKNIYGEQMMLHHGTLLFSADTSRLAGALAVDPEKLSSKGIKSVSSRIKNIVSLEGYVGPRNVEVFMDGVFREVAGEDADGFTDTETRGIEALRDEKFSTWEWNFGSSPSHAASKKHRFTFGTVSAEVSCRDGRIENVIFTGDFFGTEDISELERSLRGLRYEYTDVLEKLGENRKTLEKCIAGAAPEDILSVIF